MRVPEDVAIIGFGDVEMGAYLRPRLTTLSTHSETAARLLSEMFHSPGLPPPRLQLLQRQLVLRDSA